MRKTPTTKRRRGKGASRGEVEVKLTEQTQKRVEIVKQKLETAIRDSAVARDVAVLFDVSYRMAQEYIRIAYEQMRAERAPTRPFVFERMEDLKLTQLEEAEQVRQLAIAAALGKDHQAGKEKAPVGTSTGPQVLWSWADPSSTPQVGAEAGELGDAGHVDPEVKARFLGVAVRAVAVKGHVSNQLARLHGKGFSPKDTGTGAGGLGGAMALPFGFKSEEEARARLAELRKKHGDGGRATKSGRAAAGEGKR